jgi:hypothetical protein
MRPPARDELERELAEIKGEDELVKVEAVHAWASRHRKTSAWGKRLEWDDRKAGKLYRLDQIRRILTIELKRDDHTPFVVSLSFDRKLPGGGYREFADVARSGNLMAHVLRDCFNELQRVKSKYEFLREFAGVWASIPPSPPGGGKEVEPPDEAA